MKTYCISYCREILLKKLFLIINTLDAIYNQYLELLDVQKNILISVPRKTKTFQEIKPYSQVFEVILRWFQFGEYSLEKDRLILQVKTLDKLFEYYCLYRLLKMLAEKGFQKISNGRSVFNFEYSYAQDGLYQNNRDIANTYTLRRNNTEVTLYYQPVISAVEFENNLTIYRTTKPHHGSDYYVPDFVLKFESCEDNAEANNNEEYIIFDAKFSSRDNIKRLALPEVIRKYSYELGIKSNNRSPKMVWILQGRVNNKEKYPIWIYHNSPLAIKYAPATSYGIVSMNTITDINKQLWDEIKKNIVALI